MQDNVPQCTFKSVLGKLVHVLNTTPASNGGRIHVPPPICSHIILIGVRVFIFDVNKNATHFYITDESWDCL